LSEDPSTHTENRDNMNGKCLDIPPLEAGLADHSESIATTGSRLVSTLSALIAQLGDPAIGPVALGKKLGIDKVLASRLLKGLRSGDPFSAVHRLPGPAPLRRVVESAQALGVGHEYTDAARAAVDEFDGLIRRNAGDRSTLETLLSAWIPEARREFELRRKQAAFRAMSQLRGVEAETNTATVFLRPNPDIPTMIDVVWLNALFNLKRLRPGAPVRFATRRIVSTPTGERMPVSLDGSSVDDLRGLLLPQFCSSPLPELEVSRFDNVVKYALADDGVVGGATDLVFCEVNRAELPRYLPKGSPRRTYFFAEVQVPVKTLVFDVLVDSDLFPGGEPALRVYDTALEGIASVNDRSRDGDIYDMSEEITALGTGLARCRTERVPRCMAMLDTVVQSLGWNGDRLRAYRCVVEYPIYGSQVTMLFTPETA
jgi:hypothetical protein